MKIEQQSFSQQSGWSAVAGGLDGARPQFALVFGGRSCLGQPGVLEHVRRAYPGAHVILASTSGEITGTTVSDDGACVTAVALEKSRIVCTAITVRTQFESTAAGAELAGRLRAPGLVHVFVLSDGQLVNGTELSQGFNDHLPSGVTLTGGLAGDGSRFEKTTVGLDEIPTSGRIVAIGFYGRNLRVGFGSCGGWEPFGDERVVTRADGNILFELDGQSALGLYKAQLGEAAAGLPAAALRFPLSVTPSGGGPSVVRTILSIEEVTQSMVFAGDVPSGSHVRFMRASHESLIEGAAAAAEHSRLDAPPELAICVSCVGRRLVLGDCVEGETVRVRQVLGPAPVLTGFYSYGELAPAGVDTGCQLHNQTMTITTLREV